LKKIGRCRDLIGLAINQIDVTTFKTKLTSVGYVKEKTWHMGVDQD